MLIGFFPNFRLAKILFLATCVLLTPVNYLQAQTLEQREPECGTWDWEEMTGEDNRIKITPITEDSRANCRGAFRLSNETDFHGFGGYVLELTTQYDNVDADWIPPADLDGRVYLTPPLNIEIHASPLDPSSEASVVIRGDMTLRSFSIDLSLFLLRTGLALVPGPGCAISEEQLLFTALRLSDIVTTSAELALEKDFVGAKEELLQVLPEFYERAGDMLKDIGVECAVDLFQAILKKPLALIKIGVAYLTWVPVVIVDYFKYQGRPVAISLVYAPVSLCEQLEPLNREDDSSVLQWVQCALTENNLQVFDELALELTELKYVEFTEGAKLVTKQEFLDDLALRLSSEPQCNGYVLTNGKLEVWTSGWQPVWELDYIETNYHEEPLEFSPPHTSDVIGFFFSLDENGFYIETVWIDVWNFLEEALNNQIIPCDLFATEIVTFYPIGTIGEELEGSCWTSSLVAQRPDAWRCATSASIIHDPCFGIAEDDTVVICDASPLGDGQGFKLNLTEPLPAPFQGNQEGSWWILELADGTICTQIQGTGIQVGNELFHATCGSWLLSNISFTDEVWIAELVKPSADSSSLESTQMYVKIVWR